MFSQNTIIHVFSNIFLTRYLSNEVKFAFSSFSRFIVSLCRLQRFEKKGSNFHITTWVFPCLHNLHRQHLEVFLIPKPTLELNGIQKIQQRIGAMCIVCSQKQRYFGLHRYLGCQKRFHYQCRIQLEIYSWTSQIFLSNPFIQLKRREDPIKSLRSTPRWVIQEMIFHNFHKAQNRIKTKRNVLPLLS